MRKIIILLLLCVCAMTTTAQIDKNSRRIMTYKEFKPAAVTLLNNQVVTVPLANIFMKRSTLVYHNISGKNMEAKLSNVKSVDFDDRHYERIDTMLAWRVDTVGNNALFCVTKIDLSALRNNIINSRSMTNIELTNSLLNTATLDVDMEDFDYPLINIYFYKYNDKIIPVQEREIYRRIPKNKRYDFKVVTSLPTFSWTDPKSLLDLLKHISD